MSGPIGEINLGQILMKNLTIIGSTLRSKTDDEKSSLIKEALEKAYPLIDADKIKPVIDSEFNFNDIDKAITKMKSRKHFGKIIISLI